MTESKICTCPSGDGSLRWPCPAHPAEQAGGDERAAFDAYRDRRNAVLESEGHKPGSKWHVTNAHYPTWEASRAALAQPSPDAPYADGIAADLERSDWTPEDALRWYAAGKHFYTVNGRTRIIDTGAVASNALKHLSLPYLEMKGDAKLTELREAMAQPSPAPVCTTPTGENCPGDGVKSCKKCPEQAEAERPEGPTEDELEAAGLGYPLHKEEAVKLWYSGFRSEVITVLEAWEAIGHDIGMNPDKGELLDSLRYMLEKCEAHDAALARVAELEKELAMARDAAAKGDAARHAAGGMEMEIQELKTKLAELEKQEPVAWMHDQPNRVDVIHRDVKDLLQRVPGSSRGIHRPLDVSEHYTIPLYAAPVAQAQHSVPEGWMLVPVEPLLNMMSDKGHDTRITAERQLLSILAAAPGKEGV